MGSPKNMSAAVAIAARVDGTTSCGTSGSTRTLDDEDRPRRSRTACCCEVVPVRALAGDGEERRAGGDPARVVGEVSHLDGVGAAENRLRCERGDEALELHGATSYRV